MANKRYRAVVFRGVDSEGNKSITNVLEIKPGETHTKAKKFNGGVQFFFDSILFELKRGRKVELEELE